MTKPPRGRAWSAPLADFLDDVVAPALAKQGFGESSVVLHWDEIVGERLFVISQPIRIAWPPRGRNGDPSAPSEPATLVLRVESAFALEIQHLAPVILERVNAHLGWRCVGKLQIRQGPIVRATHQAPEKAAPDAGALHRAVEASGSLLDEKLRDAMTRLGSAVLSAPSPGDRR